MFSTLHADAVVFWGTLLLCLVAALC